jgi:hypothetical protein
VSDETASRPVARIATLDVAYDRFHRVVAAFCLLCGVLYWMRLMGVHPGAAWRFDLMPLHWQAASAALAVLFPFAAVGMWLVAPWGPVIWFGCAVIEAVMYGIYPGLFGHRDWTLAAHAVIGLAYLGFRIALHLRRRRALTGD